MTTDAIDRRSSAPITMLSIAWACLMLAPATSARAEPTVEREAEDAMHEGIDFLRKKQLPEAEAKFEQAWKLKKTSDIAANLGSTELKLARYREAAEHLWYSLSTLPLTSPQKARAAIETELAEAKAHVGQLTLDVAPPSAEVKVDDVQIGVAPLAAPVFVEPGTHKVSAAHPGSMPGEWTVTLKAGEEMAKTLRLEPAPQEGTGGAGPIASGSGAIVPPPPPTARPVWPGVVGLALGGSALITGIASTVASNAAASDAASTPAAVRRSCASASPNDECKAAFDSQRKANLTGNLAFGGFVAGGALLAASIPYLVWATAKHEKPAARSIQVLPLLSPVLQGVTFDMAF